MLTLAYVADTLLGPGTGSGLPTVPVSRIVVDSRECCPGSLFFAFKGTCVDGHDYVGDAIRRGAVAAVVRHDWRNPGIEATVLTKGQETTAISVPPLIMPVPDTLWALQTLAGSWRRLMPATVVGVTGSIGKTLTRDVIAAVLSSRYCVHSSERNYNNEIGLPLSLLRLNDKHQYAVLEMGMYAIGEIATLARLALPTIGVVTNVGPTHLERLGSIERIAEAKRELVAALPADGLAVLNGDDARVLAMRAGVRGRVTTYGLSPENDLWADNLTSRGLAGMEFDLHADGGVQRLILPLPGIPSVYAALAGIAVGRTCDLTWDEMRWALSESAHCARMKLIDLGGIHLLDDTYNAAPASVMAALDLLRQMPGRRVAVLGDMLELGAYSEAGHREVGRRVCDTADVLMTVGKQARWIAEEACHSGLSNDNVHLMGDQAEVMALLPHILRPGDSVLVKGSRGMHMETIVEALAQLLSVSQP